MAAATPAVQHFFVCINERPASSALPSCAPAGGRAVYEAFLKEIARRGYPSGLKVTATACLTPCQIGPNVVVYPEGVWYAEVSAEDVAEMIDAHQSGQTLSRLMKPAHIRVW